MVYGMARYSIYLEKEREREREREKERNRERDRETETETERQRQRETETEKERDRDRDRDREYDTCTCSRRGRSDSPILANAINEVLTASDNSMGSSGGTTEVSISVHSKNNLYRFLSGFSVPTSAIKKE